jgi:hypothetical protein
MKHKKIFVNMLLLGWMYFFSQGIMAADKFLWKIQEVYSNDDGSIQFIELFSEHDNQNFPNKITIESRDSSDKLHKAHVFTTSGLIDKTENHSLLLATPGFSVLPGGVTPDYVIPFDFLITAGGTLRIFATFGEPSGKDELEYDKLEYEWFQTKGVSSFHLNGNGSFFGANSPTNFAGETGRLTQNSYAIFDATQGILRIPVMDVKDSSGNTSTRSAILQLTDATTYTFIMTSYKSSNRAKSDPGFHDNPFFDTTTTSVAVLPFVAWYNGTHTEQWYAELKSIPFTDPWQFQLISPDEDAQTHHYHPTIKIFLELVMENSLKWKDVPLQVKRDVGSIKRTHTIESIYRDVGIDLISNQNTISDFRDERKHKPYTEAELLQIQTEFMKTSRPKAAAGRWHMYGIFVPEFTGTARGTLFTTNTCTYDDPCAPIIQILDENIRTGFAVFVKNFTTKVGGKITAKQGYLRTTAHELGHALNLIHADGDAEDWVNDLGITIMNETWRLSKNWNYLWNDKSFTHFNHHPVERIRPSVLGNSTAFDWLKCHTIYGDVQ